MPEYLSEKGKKALDRALEDVMAGGLYRMKDGKFVKMSSKDRALHKNPVLHKKCD